MKLGLKRLLRAIKMLDKRLRYYRFRQGYYATINRHKYRLASGPDDAPDGPIYHAALSEYRQLLDYPPKPPPPKPKPGRRGPPKKPLPDWAITAYQAGRSIDGVAAEVGL